MLQPKEEEPAGEDAASTVGASEATTAGAATTSALDSSGSLLKKVLTPGRVAKIDGGSDGGRGSSSSSSAAPARADMKVVVVSRGEMEWKTTLDLLDHLQLQQHKAKFEEEEFVEMEAMQGVHRRGFAEFATVLSELGIADISEQEAIFATVDSATVR